MRNASLELCGAGGVRATRCRLVIARNGLAAGRTNGRHFVRNKVLFSALHFNGNDLGNDIARLLNVYRITDTDIALTDEINVMERCRRDRRSRESHGLKDRLRCQNARSANLDHNVNELRRLALGRIFVSDRPFRRAGIFSDLQAFTKIVAFDNDTVDIKRKRIAKLSDLLDLGYDLVGCTELFSVRDHVEAEGFQIIKPLGMGRKRGAVRALDIKDHDVETSARSDLGIKLAQRACRRVARIGKQGLALRFSFRVELLEALSRHINLTAHLEKRGRIFKRKRDRFDGLQVFRDVFPRQTVAPRRADRKYAVAVFERNGKSVDLRLYGKARLVSEHRFDSFHKLVDFSIRKNVGKASHSDRMLHLLKFVERLAADALRRGIRGCKLGVFLLQSHKLVEKLIVFVVRNGRCVTDIIKPRVMVDQLFQFLHALFRILFFVHDTLHSAACAAKIKFEIFCAVMLFIITHFSENGLFF